MFQACVISTGTELLLGATVDKNAHFLSQKLSELGLKVIGRYTAGDNRDQIYRAFKSALETADVIISSGGLGPTLDDLTKEVACEVLGCPLELVEEEVARLKDFFARRRREMPAANLKQAMFPPGALILRNDKGTAPGMYLRKEGKTIILLPGPPHEMQAMYLGEVEPLLRADNNLNEKLVASRTIKVFGPGESQVDEMLSDVISDARGCSLALLAQEGEVHIKVTAEGENARHSRMILDEVSRRIESSLGKYIFGYDGDSLSAVVAALLCKKGKVLALAESCTGGLLAQMITDLPGSSQYFWGSVTSYSHAAKVRLLGVQEDTLNRWGAVSAETAEEMAGGILKRSGADISLAITGIAGPDGGTGDKPVGLVYMAMADANGVKVKEMHFAGGRQAIRMLSAKTALDMLRKGL